MEPTNRLTKTKEQWAKARRGGEEREVFHEGDSRLPPGQHLVETWPVRVIVPKHYAWKGAKWVKNITFADRDEKGFWEVRGYSNTALPWENDRYG